jgi:hypothetical protein
MPSNAGRLTWDGAGQKKYTLGVEKGVLYIPTNGVYSLGVAWNGLTKVGEKPSGADEQKFYADNIQYGSLRGAEDFGGTIECFTYPDEFGVCNGEIEIAPGVKGNQQTRKPFGLSYINKLGNDTTGMDYGYEIHLVYNATTSPSEKDHETINDSPSPETMSFEFACNPTATKFSPKPMSHITINSTTVDADKLAAFEDILYGKDADTDAGTPAVAPTLPLPDAVYDHFNGQ